MEGDDGVIGMRLTFCCIVPRLVELLEVGIIDIARDVFTVETTGIKCFNIRRVSKRDINQIVERLVEQAVAADGGVDLLDAPAVGDELVHGWHVDAVDVRMAYGRGR